MRDGEEMICQREASTQPRLIQWVMCGPLPAGSKRILRQRQRFSWTVHRSPVPQSGTEGPMTCEAEMQVYMLGSIQTHAPSQVGKERRYRGQRNGVVRSIVQPRLCPNVILGGDDGSQIVCGSDKPPADGPRRKELGELGEAGCRRSVCVRAALLAEDGCPPSEVGL